MVGLGANGSRRRLFERSVLLQGLVERFDVPPFAVDVHDLAAGEVGLTAHQILDAGAPVFVCEDLLDQRQREINTFQVDLPCDTRFQCQPIDAHITTLLFIRVTQGQFAISFQA